MRRRALAAWPGRPLASGRRDWPAATGGDSRARGERATGVTERRGAGKERGLGVGGSRREPGAPAARARRRPGRGAARARARTRAAIASSSDRPGLKVWLRRAESPARRTSTPIAPAARRKGFSRRAARRARASAISSRATRSLRRSRIVASSWTRPGARRRRSAAPARPRGRAEAGRRGRPRRRPRGPPRRTRPPRRPSRSRPARGPRRGAGGRPERRDGLAGQEGVLVARAGRRAGRGAGPAGGDARREARGGEAERGVEAEPPLQLVADRLGGRGPAAGRRRPSAREVDEGLVGGGPLDAAARGEEHGGHLVADAGRRRRGRRGGRRRRGTRGAPAPAACPTRTPACPGLLADRRHEARCRRRRRPITTGRPRREGSRARSTETKNGSRSTCRMLRRRSLTPPG